MALLFTCLLAMSLVSTVHGLRKNYICGQSGYSLNHPAPFRHLAHKTPLECYSYCQSHSRCISFATGNDECFFYDAPVRGNFHVDLSSPYRFYNHHCRRHSLPSTTTSTTPTSSAATQPDSSSTSSTQSTTTTTTSTTFLTSTMQSSPSTTATTSATVSTTASTTASTEASTTVSTTTPTTTPTTTSTATSTTATQTGASFCADVAPQCSSSVYQQCLYLAQVTVTPSPMTVTATQFLTTTDATNTIINSPTITLPLTLTSTAPDVTETVDISATFDEFETVTNIDTVTVIDTIDTTAIVTLPLPTLRRRLADPCAVADYSAVCACLGVPFSTVTVTAMTETAVVTSFLDATATFSTDVTATLTETTIVDITPVTTIDNLVTETDTLTATATSVVDVTATTIDVVATATVTHVPLQTFNIVLNYPNDPTNANVYTYFDTSADYLYTGPGSSAIGYTSNPDGQALFTLDTETGILSAATTAQAGETAFYSEDYSSWVGMADSAADSSAGSTALECSVDLEDYALTCMYGSSQGVLFTCGDILAINAPPAEESNSCGYGNFNIVTLTAVPVV